MSGARKGTLGGTGAVCRLRAQCFFLEKLLSLSVLYFTLPLPLASGMATWSPPMGCLTHSYWLGHQCPPQVRDGLLDPSVFFF